MAVTFLAAFFFFVVLCLVMAVRWTGICITNPYSVNWIFVSNRQNKFIGRMS